MNAGRHVRQQKHVGFVDGLEPADRGSVEGEAVRDDAVVERIRTGRVEC